MTANTETQRKLRHNRPASNSQLIEGFFPVSSSREMERGSTSRIYTRLGSRASVCLTLTTTERMRIAQRRTNLSAARNEDREPEYISLAQSDEERKYFLTKWIMSLCSGFSLKRKRLVRKEEKVKKHKYLCRLSYLRLKYKLMTFFNIVLT